MGMDMTSSAVIRAGSRPSATARHTMSRSVTMPIAFCVCGSTTGTAPQSFATIILATSSSASSGLQNTSDSVITSRTCIGGLLSSHRRGGPGSGWVRCPYWPQAAYPPRLVQEA
jgi:hypothetical protein